MSSLYDIPFLPSYLPDVKPFVVNLFHREVGLVLAPGNPLDIRGIDDLTQKGVRLVNRQKQSDTRTRLDHHREPRKIPPSTITGHGREVYTHFEGGFSTLFKEVDVRVATIPVARLFGLPFVPIAAENLDLTPDQGTVFYKGVPPFLGIPDFRRFRKRVERNHTYDFRDA